ncbi:glycosyl transferase, family 8 [Grosmannia clavigera kw1407]|uniref:glycogenin glucosyltransferase n=1 Tax=Grosmannia clavigera (strain kw1407 / UAMH 11150) TaxID=655863 RepID=F0XM79_GROCL|nr:glycosyl transferase, family 8 [Grosmannia clavigera kw1407]EFX01305.1 glycosyl transferase, family 8 [Grosmannia clavigera kw1407]
MAQQDGEDVYATLLLTDSYLPGALVLAHSLRDAGTTKKLAVLVTADTVSNEVAGQLRNVFDYVIPVTRIRNVVSPANLDQMNRPDLHSAFTKIHLWNQTQFRKIVYIDADVVAYRAPDELFDLPNAFAAAPDIGWPDLFNTGVMVITPDVGEYNTLLEKAQNGISFDGADQGLLNIHFKGNFHRLSFTYNVTPSAHYQYLPAYNHFRSSINMVHFIGTNKPWVQGRGVSTGSTAYDEMVGQWWSVYDRHYSKAAPELVQYFVKGEFKPTGTFKLTADGQTYNWGSTSYGQHHEAQPPSFTQHQHQHQHQQQTPFQDSNGENQDPSGHQEPGEIRKHGKSPGNHDHCSHTHNTPHFGLPISSPSLTIMETENREDQIQASMHYGWDAQRQPPPVNARPEALNLPRTHYEMSQDTNQFVAPRSYPSPPHNMYDIPTGAHQKPHTVFPWEGHQPAPTRVFAEPAPPPPHEAPVEEQSSQSGLYSDQLQEELGTEPSVTSGSPSIGPQTEPTTPTTPTARQYPPADPWASYTRTNAWDDVPQIERYVDSFQKQHLRARSRGQVPGTIQPKTSADMVTGSGGGIGEQHGSRVTDFPSEAERPSLPVTPAPVRRPKYWAGDGPGFGVNGDADAVNHLLPAADGVPQQSDWDPVAQLQKLAKQQSKALLRRLGPEDGTVTSIEEDMAGTGVRVVSPKPVKPSALKTNFVRNLGGDNITIVDPSYMGPGISFEKDEGFLSHGMAAALPSEEDMDVLDT